MDDEEVEVDCERHRPEHGTHGAELCNGRLHDAGDSVLPRDLIGAALVVREDIFLAVDGQSGVVIALAPLAVKLYEYPHHVRDGDPQVHEGYVREYLPRPRAEVPEAEVRVDDEEGPDGGQHARHANDYLRLLRVSWPVIQKMHSLPGLCL